MKSLISRLIVAFALIAPAVSNAASSSVKLSVSCNSEDDGVLNVVLEPSQNQLGTYVFDNMIAGKMSVSRLRIAVNLDVQLRDFGAVLGDGPEITLYPRNNSIAGGFPLASMRVTRDIPLPRGETAGFSLNALGQTDPEGISCYIGVVVA